MKRRVKHKNFEAMFLGCAGKLWHSLTESCCKNQSAGSHDHSISCYQEEIYNNILLYFFDSPGCALPFNRLQLPRVAIWIPEAWWMLSIINQKLTNRLKFFILLSLLRDFINLLVYWLWFGEVYSDQVQSSCGIHGQWEDIREADIYIWCNDAE